MRVAMRSAAAGLRPRGMRNVADNASRAAWFTHVWDAAQKTASASPGSEPPAATATQLLSVRAPSGVFPRSLALQMWRTYEAAAPNEHEAPGEISTAVVVPPHIASKLGDVNARRVSFFISLAQLGVDMSTLRRETGDLAAALDKIGDESAADVAVVHRALSKASVLRERCTPLYERWFNRMLAVPDGAKRLITMRAELLACKDALGKIAKQPAPEAGDDAADPRPDAKRVLEALEPVAASLTSVLREWSSAAWLTIDELSWSKTPAMVAEQMMTHEAVHRFASLEDVRRRMQPSPHRCAFALFHPAVIAEPLTMVVVALTHGIADNVDTILNTGGQSKLLDFSDVPHSHPLLSSGYADAEAKGAAAPDTAIFYSITSTQAGMRGIELGNGLIKGAVKHIQQAHPNVAQFSTLSPVPGYGGWLRQHVRSVTPSSTLPSNLVLGELFGLTGDPSLADVSISEIADALAARHDRKVDPVPRDVAIGIMDTLASKGSKWWDDARLAAALKPLMMPSVRHYLKDVKRRGKAFDPVANFHIRNGASLYRLNWLANCTDKASSASGGIMVNYLYDLARVEENATNYAEEGVIRETGFSNLGGPSRRR